MNKPKLETFSLGVDTGGTFTDFFLVNGEKSRIHKVLSTPSAPEKAILQGISELGLDQAVSEGCVTIIHGSTVATNAALEGKGVKTAFITNKGFADMLTLGRQERPDIYALQPKIIPPPVPPELCFEIDCRRDYQGNVITALNPASLEKIKNQIESSNVEAVAVNLLFSYVNAEDEHRIAEVIPDSVFVSCSHDVLAEYKEYERGIATWLNAWLGPIVESYIQRLKLAVQPSPLGIMQSSGGTISAEQASRKAVNLLLSGPAGGLAAADFVGKTDGQTKLLTFDMGGTSTDVALLDGGIGLSSEGKIGRFPVAVPMVDMHTIGAGGGSIAYMDEGGMLHVGPESAGAQPGPACYGQGGQQVTVTDANAVLGRLRSERFLGGRMSLDLDAANNALQNLATQMNTNVTEAAAGVLTLANEHMVSALRVISIQRGYDPADFELCCFGGAGGLHVCALADELGTNKIVIPANGGVLSAVGMLTAPSQRNLSRTVNLVLDRLDTSTLLKQIDELRVLATQELRAEGINSDLEENVSVDLRYKGQTFTLSLPFINDSQALIEKFHQAHKSRYGHSLPLEIELLNLRVQLSAKSLINSNLFSTDSGKNGKPFAQDHLPELGMTELWDRDQIGLDDEILGPAIICEEVATTLVGIGWQCRKDRWGHLRMMKI